MHLARELKWPINKYPVAVLSVIHAHLVQVRMIHKEIFGVLPVKQSKVADRNRGKDYIV